MNSNTLNQLIEKKHIEGVDLSTIDINGRNFTGCTIINVKFSKKNQHNRILTNVNFTNATLENVDFIDAKLDNVKFDNAIMEGCSFQIYSEKVDKPTIDRVSYKKCTIRSCRFRDAEIKYSDFRYAEITNSTFENSNIEFCDFYRTLFIGQNIFYYSKIIDSSIPTYFEGTIIRRDNLTNDRILQQNYRKYRIFLEDWYTIRENDRDEKAIFDIKKSHNARYKQAENIYRELNGLWNSKGYFSDANWAYIQARRMERKSLIYDLINIKGVFNKIILLPRIIWNCLCDLCFGYGESILKTIATYFVIVLIFANILNIKLPDCSFLDSIWYSIKNMIAQTPEEIMLGRTLVDMLNLVQSTLGILITGILGFIIANKIRNQ